MSVPSSTSSSYDKRLEAARGIIISKLADYNKLFTHIMRVHAEQETAQAIGIIYALRSRGLYDLSSSEARGILAQFEPSSNIIKKLEGLLSSKKKDTDFLKTKYEDPIIYKFSTDRDFQFKTPQPPLRPTATPLDKASYIAQFKITEYKKVLYYFNIIKNEFIELITLFISLSLLKEKTSVKDGELTIQSLLNLVNSKDISTRVRTGLEAKITEVPFRTKRDPELTVSPELNSQVLRTLSVIEQKVEQPARPAPPPKQNIGRPLPSPHEPIRGDAIFRQGVTVPVDGFDPRLPGPLVVGRDGRSTHILHRNFDKLQGNQNVFARAATQLNKRKKEMEAQVVAQVAAAQVAAARPRL